jgi:hypothetical protein
MPFWPLLSGDDLVQEVDKMKPQWDGRWSLERYQQVFDDVGLLRPIYRVVLPKRYAYFLAARLRLDVKVTLDSGETEAFEEARDAVLNWRSGGDPEVYDYFKNPPPALAPFVRLASQEESIDWNSWQIPVAEHQGRAITEPIAYSFYGAWQCLRFWALLEGYTFRGLMDPRQLSPAQVFAPDWDHDLKGRIMTWMVGNPRILRVIEELEADGWLSTLYLHREMDNWAQLRAYEPRLARWKEGEGMTPEARATFETDRLRTRTRLSGGKWVNDRDAFWSQLGRVLELWSQARRLAAGTLAERVENDLWAAVRWAGFMYGDDLDAIDRAVRPAPLVDATVKEILLPEWSRAAHKVERQLVYLLEHFGQDLLLVTLKDGDSSAFLAFLEENELTAWSLELSGLLRELESPTDVSSDRRFLHLKSLSTLVEPILVGLADDRGTAVDRGRMNRGSTKEPLKAFLADRTVDWRARLWQIVEEHWDLTRTGDGISFEAQLDSIERGAWDLRLTPIAKMVLTLGALRNFGSHRFSRDRELLSKYQGQLLRAVTWTPIFYWKVATTLG